MSWKNSIAALLGISAYQKPPEHATSIDDDAVERLREILGGQLAPMATTQTRWYLRDLESAIRAADGGDVSGAARLYKAFRRDGTIAGLLATRTSGLVRLPKRFRGDSEIVEALERRDEVTARSIFEDMFPSSELALLAADGITLGVGVGELVRVEGRDFPVLVRLDPEFLRYRWNENRWYYQSIAGQIPITPGDGRWVLHVPGGRMSPWQHGLWGCLGENWINKQHSKLHRANFSGKLANPARAATAPQGATEAERRGFLANLIGWGVNTTFELPVGWDVKLIESNGRGFDVFEAEIASCNQEIIISLAGQTVTTDGGTGFANADIHKSIRADLIQETGDALAYTINTQGIPQFVARRWGLDGLRRGGAIVEWDTKPPKDLKNESDALKSFGEGIETATRALAPYERRIDVDLLCTRFGLPIAGDGDGDGTPDGQPPIDPDEIDVTFDDEDEGSPSGDETRESTLQ